MSGNNRDFVRGLLSDHALDSVFYCLLADAVALAANSSKTSRSSQLLVDVTGPLPLTSLALSQQSTLCRPCDASVRTWMQVEQRGMKHLATLFSDGAERRGVRERRRRGRRPPVVWPVYRDGKFCFSPPTFFNDAD